MSQKTTAQSELRQNKAAESGGQRTDFNNEEKTHEDEVRHRKHGALVFDCEYNCYDGQAAGQGGALLRPN